MECTGTYSEKSVDAFWQDSSFSERISSLSTFPGEKSLYYTKNTQNAHVKTSNILNREYLRLIVTDI